LKARLNSNKPVDDVAIFAVVVVSDGVVAASAVVVVSAGVVVVSTAAVAVVVAAVVIDVSGNHTSYSLHHESKKQDSKLLPITSSNVNRFSCEI